MIGEMENMGKYVSIRMPVNALMNFKLKQNKMQEDLFKITNKPIPVPMTKMFVAISKYPLEIDRQFLLNNFLKKRGSNG